MIGHQAIGMNFTFKLFFETLKITDVVLEIFVVSKNSLPIMAPLDYVMRTVGNNDTSFSWHD